jgi:hypothetical protein
MRSLLKHEESNILWDSLYGMLYLVIVQYMGMLELLPGMLELFPVVLELLPNIMDFSCKKVVTTRQKITSSVRKKKEGSHY